mgnify:CR=1 FL=1
MENYVMVLYQFDVDLPHPLVRLLLFYARTDAVVQVPTIFAFGRAVLFCFWLPIFAVGENWEPKESLFHAAAGEKDIVLKRPRKSCMKGRTRRSGQRAFSPSPPVDGGLGGGQSGVLQSGGAV